MKERSSDGSGWDPAGLQLVIEDAAERTSFSGVVEISQGGGVLASGAFGFADRSGEIANTANTRFGIASGTKTITAAAILVLADRGVLGLDSRISDLLDIDFPNFSPEITIHHLLTHTSGIFDYYDEELVTDFDNFSVSIPWYQLETPTDYLPLFQNEGMKFAPGERFSYSNGGYVLLGIVVEQVTGMLFREFVETAVLSPAGCDESGFFAMNRLPPRCALGYMEEESGWRTNIFQLPVRGGGDGGLFMTVGDVGRFWRTYQLGPLLAEPTRVAATTGHARMSPTLSYGYGIYVSSRFPKLTLRMIGSDAGVGFDSLLVPDDDLIITVISNVTDGHEEVRDSVFGWLQKSLS